MSSTKNTVQNALVILKNFVPLDFILQLEMVSAMMRQILVSVAMMVETVACLVSLQIIAQNALVIFLILVLLVFILQLEMAIAMMKQIIQSVTMMVVTVV